MASHSAPQEQGRADCYGLIAALLLTAPHRRLLQALSDASPMPGHSALARAWRELTAAARAHDISDIAAEHAALFVAPGNPLLDPCASRYLTGSMMDERRAVVRGRGVAGGMRCAAHARDGRGWPIEVSVSHAEGARMLGSGDAAAGVPMPIEIHQWLGAYLRIHHRPRCGPRARA